ncbi:hypothetical protein [Novosphingobium humi]|uniref:hypothetical protein n=1 Tax=Novosphingobium humi TaxID=2282397 RepID=UPI0025B11B07|nr:hypothetical protein [Novosphingobium humi]WJT00784.1 hypothetical protein NYQ05_16845 [Novosphingobium humi]
MSMNSIISRALTGVMALAAFAPLHAAPVASCDRACLTGVMESYINAIPTHDRTGQPLAAGVKETVNGRASSAQSDYFWKLVDGITYRQIVADPATGQVAMLGVATEAGGRGAYWLRLAVKNRQITEIEQIIGDRPAGGVPGLAAPNPYFEQVLPEKSRSTREQLIAIADSYFEGLQRHDGAGVQSAPGCRRYENGNQTSLNPLGNTWACNVMSDYTYMDKIKERRFPIVDVERGIVVGAMVIEVSKPKANAAITGVAAGGSQSVLPLFSRPHDTLIQEIFKIADGKIQEINVIRQDMPYQWGSGW